MLSPMYWITLQESQVSLLEGYRNSGYFEGTRRVFVCMVERRILEWQLPAAKRARSTTAMVNQVNFLEHPYSPNPKPNANFNPISPAMWRLNGLPGADATGGRLASSKARWGLGVPPSTSTTVSVLMFEFLTIPSWGPPHFGGGV